MTSRLKYENWPIERSELLSISDFLLDQAPKSFSSIYRGDNFSSRCLVNLSGRLLQDLLSFVVSVALKQRSGDAIFFTDGLNATPFMEALYGTGSIEGVATIKMLQSGLKDVSGSRKIARLLKGVVVRDNLTRLPLGMTDLDSDIISLSIQPLILKRAGTTTRRVNLIPPHRWFPKVEASRIVKISQGEDFNTITSAILELACECLRLSSLNIKKSDVDLLGEFVEQALSLVGAYALQLDSKSNQLPQRLWSGSSGIIWIRLLQDAVLRNGGRVTGFDHAEGADIDESCKYGFVELQTVNKFVTFGRLTAKNFRRAAESYNFTGLKPEIESFSNDLAKSNTIKIAKNNNPKVSTMLFLPPAVNETACALYPLLSPVQGVNFTRKVLSYALDAGIRVLMKPHHEMKFSYSKFIPQMPNVDLIETGRSEDYFGQVDVLFLDYPMQTTMGSALQTDLPIALIDTGQMNFTEELRAAISQRVGYIKILEDGAGDWNFDQDHFKLALDQAIVAAPNTSYLDEFMK